MPDINTYLLVGIPNSDIVNRLPQRASDIIQLLFAPCLSLDSLQPPTLIASSSIEDLRYPQTPVLYAHLDVCPRPNLPALVRHTRRHCRRSQFQRLCDAACTLSLYQDPISQHPQAIQAST